MDSANAPERHVHTDARAIAATLSRATGGGANEVLNSARHTTYFTNGGLQSAQRQQTPTRIAHSTLSQLLASAKVPCVDDQRRDIIHRASLRRRSVMSTASCELITSHTPERTNATGIDRDTHRNEQERDEKDI